MKTFLFLLALVAATAVFAGPPVDSVVRHDGAYMTLPVVHDTTGRDSLTAAEETFLATVPAYDGLRNRVRELLLGKVCHVPQGGKYDPNNPDCNRTHYETLYQAWTGPHKVTIPVIPGPPGQPGVGIKRAWIQGCDLWFEYTDGRTQNVGRVVGQDGRAGCDGQTIVVEKRIEAPCAPPPPPANQPVYNITLVPATYSSGQMLGIASPMVNTWQLLGVATTSPARINVTATGGAGGSSNVNVANTNVNSNANNNAINIGDGSASGTAEANGAGDSTAGNQ